MWDVVLSCFCACHKSLYIATERQEEEDGSLRWASVLELMCPLVAMWAAAHSPCLRISHMYRYVFLWRNELKVYEACHRTSFCPRLLCKVKMSTNNGSILFVARLFLFNWIHFLPLWNEGLLYCYNGQSCGAMVMQPIFVHCSTLVTLASVPC